MKRLLSTVFSVAVLAFIVGCSVQADKGKQDNQETVETAMVGQAAPDFKLADANGNQHALSDFEGKYVVLEWVNFDCPFVRKHYDVENMQALQAAYVKNDVVWLSICSSAPGKQGYFEGQELLDRIERENLKASAYLVDTKGEVGRLYGAKTTPNMYVVNPEGVLIYAGAIDDKPSTKSADIPGSNNYVVAALTAAMTSQDIEIKSTQPYGCSVKY